MKVKQQVSLSTDNDDDVTQVLRYSYDWQTKKSKATFDFSPPVTSSSSSSFYGTSNCLCPFVYTQVKETDKKDNKESASDKASKMRPRKIPDS